MGYKMYEKLISENFVPTIFMLKRNWKEQECLVYGTLFRYMTDFQKFGTNYLKLGISDFVFVAICHAKSTVEE